MNTEQDAGTEEVFSKILQRFLKKTEAELCRRVVFIAPPLEDDPVWDRHVSGNFLIYLLSGTQRVCFTDSNGHQEYIQKPGDVLYLGPNIRYTNYWNTPCRRLGIMVDKQKICISWNDNKGQTGEYTLMPDILLTKTLVDNNDIFPLFTLLAHRSSVQKEASDKICRTVPVLLLHALMNTMTGAQEPYPHLSRPEQLFNDVMEYIDLNIGVSINRKTAAYHFRVSEGYLTRLFRTYTGSGFTEFLIQRRMTLAWEMLHAGNNSVTETGREFGYSDPSYFVKVFRKYWKVLPGELLRNHAKKKV